ncbi:hypothetical protein [Tortoise microvirus 19]|nr:hypothetical protein [Tortoise microvirus 19]
MEENEKQNSLGLSQDKANYSDEERIEMQRGIVGTPLKVVRVEETYKIAFGKYIVCSKNFGTIEEAEEFVETKPGLWDIVVGLMGVATTEAIKEISRELTDELKEITGEQ